MPSSRLTTSSVCDGLARGCNDEPGKRELTPPSRRLTDEAVEPFETGPPPHAWCSRNCSRNDIERTTDTDAHAALRRSEIVLEPIFLLRTSKPHQQYVRFTRDDRCDNRRALSGREIAVTRSHNGDAGIAIAQRDRRTFRDAGRAAEEKEPPCAAERSASGSIRSTPVTRSRSGPRRARDASSRPIVSQIESAAPFTRLRKRVSRCANIVISTPSVTTSDGVSPCARATMRSTASARLTASTRQPRMRIEDSVRITPAGRERSAAATRP